LRVHASSTLRVHASLKVNRPKVTQVL
jgi:hypothetical protein